MSKHINMGEVVVHNTEAGWQTTNILKALVQHDKEIYNEAIDDFVEILLYEFGATDIQETIKSLAEELKGAQNNEN